VSQSDFLLVSFPFLPFVYLAWDKSNQEELTDLEKTFREGNLLRSIDQTKAKAEVKDTEWQQVLKNKQFDDEYYQRLKEVTIRLHFNAKY
jgi:hypothetical protein